MSDCTIRLSRTERHVLEQIRDGNHTLDDLTTATGYPRPRLLKYLSWLDHDEFVELTQPDGSGTALRVDLTDRGIDRCDNPRSWQTLLYD